MPFRCHLPPRAPIPGETCHRRELLAYDGRMAAVAEPSSSPSSAGSLTLPAVFERLEAMHGGEVWHWDPPTPPFEVMVGAILVQRTTWRNAERALERLRTARALEPDTLLSLPEGELEALVRPAGFFRTKARKLRALATFVREAGGVEAVLAMPGDELRARLLATWGIGPETADAIVLYAAQRPAFVVDGFTRRVFRRLGMGPATETYEAWQRWFTERLPPDVRLWARAHALLVLHAKGRCRKRDPRCEGCLLREGCAYEAATSTPSGVLR